LTNKNSIKNNFESPQKKLSISPLKNNFSSALKNSAINQLKNSNASKGVTKPTLKILPTNKIKSVIPSALNCSEPLIDNESSSFIHFKSESTSSSQIRLFEMSSKNMNSEGHSKSRNKKVFSEYNLLHEDTKQNGHLDDR